MRDRVRLETLVLLALAASLAGNYFMGPLPFSLPGAKYSGKAYATTYHDKVLNEAIKLIPKNAVVTVGNNIGSHLSARRTVYVFPYYAHSQYVIVDETRPYWYDQINAKLHKEALGVLVMDTAQFQNIFARDQVYVFKRIECVWRGCRRRPAPPRASAPRPAPCLGAALPAARLLRLRSLKPPS